MDEPGDRPREARREEKAPDAFRTISEVAEDLDLPQHVLRFWETRFSQIRPLKRGGGRRYYRPQDVDLLRGIRHLLYGEGYTIRGVQRILKEQGLRAVIASAQGVPVGPLPADFEPGDDEAASYEEDATVRGRSPAVHMADEDDDEGAAAMAHHLFRGDDPNRPEAPGFSAASPPALSGDDVRRLEAMLSELLECKRLLDAAR
ncbi:MAG: MerR family transcriptional regulator [Bauldia sp.]|nr:MerR family transcriptional regulator [Bauldia sp.]